MMTQKKTVKIFAFLMAALLLSSLFVSPVSALEYKKGTNSASDAYKASEYYEKLTSIKLTGDGRTDLLAVALSQLGYTEGNVNGAFGGNENGNDNFTEYNYNMGSFGAGYGGIDYPWCASFVAFCLLQSENHNQTKISDWCRKNEGDANYIWREVSCNRWAKQLRACGYFENSARFGGEYLPIPGDLIYFTEDGKLESHIGIVLFCDGEFVYTVEGNTSSASGLEVNGGGVYVKSYPLSSAYIRGYGVLPYKVNNFIHHIDYSGENPTAGRYISAADKFVYPTKDSSTYTHLLPKYSFFEVVEISDNGRLKVVCEIDGERVEGYVKNNSDRVIQLSSSVIPTAYQPLPEVWGYKRFCIDLYSFGDSSFYTKPASPTLAISKKITVSGSVSLTRDIEKFGYYFDDDAQNIVWDSDAILDSASLDVTYKIEADTSALSAGSHTLNLVLLLSDGTLAGIDSISFVAKSINSQKAVSPKLASFTESKITLAKLDGYEYKMEGGEWQSSPTFENLTENAAEPYVFYQRVAETDLETAGMTSEALSLDLGTLCNSTRLVSLSFGGVTMTSDFKFNSSVTEYSISVPYSVEKITPEASAREGAEVNIDAPESIEAGKSNEIKITVSTSVASRVYKINVFREEEPITTLPETSTSTENDFDTDIENTSGATSSEGADNGESDIDTDTDTVEGGCESSLGAVPLALIFSLSILADITLRKREQSEVEK